jgi:hypothetical protein
MKTIAPIACSALLLVACAKSEEATPVDMGYDHFPTEVGKWVEYQVDSMWRDDVVQVHDSITYQLRVEVAEAYTDPAGRSARRIERYVKNTNGEWVIRDVWTATRDERAAELTEENKRRLKLAFPARNGMRWDCNVYNTDAAQEVMIEQAGQPWSANGLSFESTLVVRNTVPANLVVRRDLVERYARGVGLVERRQEETTTNFTYPPNEPPVPVVRGFRSRMVVIDHGQ